MFAIALGCIVRLPTLSTRQSRCVDSWEWKICLSVFLGFF